MKNNQMELAKESDNKKKIISIVEKVISVATIILLSINLAIMFLGNNKNINVILGIIIGVLLIVHALMYEGINKILAIIEFVVGMAFIMVNIYTFFDGLISIMFKLFELILTDLI